MINININTTMNIKNFLAMVALTYICASQAFAVEKPAIPVDGERFFILGQDQQSILDYMADNSLPRPHGFTSYTTLTRGATEQVTNYCFKGLDGLKDLDNYNSDSAEGCADSERRNQWGSGVQNAQWLIETYQPEVVSIGMFCPGNNQAVGVYQNGSHDDLLTELADFFKSHQDTHFFLRTCYEFNGDAHGLSFDSFRGIYKHVVSYLNSQGVTNVAHVWQSDAYHGTGRSTSALGNTEQGYWPGIQYVDWVGVSQFSSDITEEASIAEAEGLPLFIAEATVHGDLGVQYDFSLPFNSSASHAQGQSNPVTAINNLTWFTDKNAEIMRVSTKAWHYINANWTQQPQWENSADQAGANFFKYTNSQVEKSAEVKAYFSDFVSSANGFILAGDGGGDSGGDDVETNNGPVISNCTLSPGSNINLGDELSLSCDISDAPEGVNTVDFSVNGISYASQSSGEASYSWVVVSTDLQLGSNSLVVTAVDNSGASSQSIHSVEVSSGEVVTPTEEFGASYVDDNTMRIYHVDNGWSAGFHYLCVNSDCRTTIRQDGLFYRDVSAVLGQSYDIEFKVQDNAIGQYIISKQVTFTSPTTPPVEPPVNSDPSVSVSLSGGELTAGDNLVINASATDTDGSIVSVAFYVTAPGGGEQLLVVDTVVPFSATVTSVIAGSYQIRVVASDDDGATGQDSASITVSPGDVSTPEDEFGLSYVNDNTMRIYHLDSGWTGSWNYLCVNSDCRVGTWGNGQFYRDVSGVLGQSYNLEFKVQDNSTGQYIVTKFGVLFTQ